MRSRHRIDEQVLWDSSLLVGSSPTTSEIATISRFADAVLLTFRSISEIAVFIPICSVVRTAQNLIDLWTLPKAWEHMTYIAMG
jgi:hypothetical protein